MASTGEVWKLGHRPALDGVRGIAVLLVVVGHTWPTAIPTALPGVGVFFTLSGFLITALLIEERASTGAISLGAFYLRRARRLLPALLTFLVVIAAFGLGVGRPLLTWAQLWPVLLYLGNVAPAAGIHTGAVLHLWSLAVEEQFYLVWPLLLVALRRNWLPWAIGCGLAWSVVASITADTAALNYATDTNLLGLLLGAGLAVFMHGRPERAARPWLATLALLAVPVLAFMESPLLIHFGVPSLTAAVLYWTATGPNGGWLQWRPLALVGKRSYALYLWHTPLAFGLLLSPLRAALPEPVAVSIFLAVSWLLATASWHLVERPILRGRSGHSGDATKELVGRDVLDRVVV